MSLHSEPYKCLRCGVLQDKPWQGVMCQMTAGCNGMMTPWFPEEPKVEVREYGPREDFIGAATEAPDFDPGPTAASVTHGLHPLPPDPALTIRVPNPARDTLPEDSAARKNIPLCTGVLDYFPAALVEVARISKAGNDKHNPGEPLHHARGKSMDHADCILRHLMDRGGMDEIEMEDGTAVQIRHSACVAWRALALLQEELEAAGAPLARGARVA